MKLHKDYYKTCYQFRLFHKGKKVVSTGDDYVYSEKAMKRRYNKLREALGGDWEVVVIEWKGFQLKL